MIHFNVGFVFILFTPGNGEKLIRSGFVPVGRRKSPGTLGIAKVDFRIKIWIKINMEKLKSDFLVIYMSVVWRRLMGKDLVRDRLKLVGSQPCHVKKMISSDDSPNYYMIIHNLQTFKHVSLELQLLHSPAQ